MNIKEFAVANKKPFDTTLIFELYEGSKFDKKTYRMIDENRRLFAEAKMDNDVFRYNLTGKMSLKKYLTLGMDKESMLRIVRRLLEVEEYFILNGLNQYYIMYDADLVLVDRETEEITVIVVPATDHGLTVKSLRAFLKEIIANAIYDEDENLDYVGRMLNYVNINKQIIPGDMEAVLGGIEATSDKATNIEMPEAVSEELQPASDIELAFDDTPVEPDDQTRLYDKQEKPEELIIDIPETIENPENIINIQDVLPETPMLPDAPMIELEDVPVVNDIKKAEEVSAEVPEVLIIPFEDEPASVEAPEDTTEETSETTPEEASEETPEVQEPVVPVEEPTIAMPVEEVKPAKKYPYLVRSKNQEIVMIDRDEFKIGKIPGMVDYLLSDNPAVSRMHAIIQHVDKGYYICDNYSTNATYLNGERLEPGKRYILLNGVKVYIANEEFTFLLEK